MAGPDYTIDELMVCQMARAMQDGELVVQGISTPLVLTAFILAKLTHAPNLYFMYTTGNSLADMPGRVGVAYLERLTLGGSLKRVTMADINCDLAPNFRPREFMRPAQVDARGNFNNTVIGDFDCPKVRLPGGAGIPDASNFNDHLNLYVPRHSPGVFVEQLDFRTGLGYGDPGQGRSSWPVVERGPNLILSDLGLFDFQQGQARLKSLHPGVTLEQVKEATGFSFAAAEPLEITPVPGRDELELIRQEIDPLGVRRLEFLGARERLEALGRILRQEQEQ